MKQDLVHAFVWHDLHMLCLPELGELHAGLADALYELSKQTVGVIGFGNIGRMVCRLLAGFKCELLYYDVDELMVGRDGELDATAVSLEELLTRSDIVTAHVPNQPSTNGRISGDKLMGKAQFDLMKEDAIYISTCRGPVTDENALIDALQSGSIYGARATSALSASAENFRLCCGAQARGWT